MRTKRIIAAAVLTCAWVTAAAAQDLLPPSVGGWIADGPAVQLPGAQIAPFSGDNAPILREYGVSSAEQRRYARDGQAATLTLYHMADPSAAYGAFTLLRNPQMQPLTLGNAVAHAAGTTNRAYVVVRNFLLDVSATASRPADADLAQLATALLPRADRRPFPIIAGFLPQDGLVPGTERYVLGPRALARVFDPPFAAPTDWLGFDRSAEVIVARYRLPGAPAQGALLLLAVYPTQQIAAQQYGVLANWIALNAEPGQATGARPAMFGTRSSALIALLAGTDSRDAARNLFGQIRYSSNVTWSEPTFEFTEPTFTEMVVGAFAYTGVIMLMAVAAGIGFGGFRLIIKLLFPGKVFDRPEQVEIIRLDLSSRQFRAGDSS